MTMRVNALIVLLTLAIGNSDAGNVGGYTRMLKQGMKHSSSVTRSKQSKMNHMSSAMAVELKRVRNGPMQVMASRGPMMIRGPSHPTSSAQPEVLPLLTSDSDDDPPMIPSLTPTMMPSALQAESPSVLPTLDFAYSSTAEFCSCTPILYDFTFNFSLGCDPVNVDLEMGGIRQTVCLIEPLGGADTNVSLVPVVVTEVRFLELNRDLSVSASTTEIADVSGGSTISFEPRTLQSGDTLGGLAIQASGLNLQGERLVFSGTIVFTNDCESFPVLVNGNSMGWIVVTTAIPPPSSICPVTAGNP